MTAKRQKIGDLSFRELAEAYVGERETTALLEERLWELELALEDEGWTKGDREGEQEFSREAMQRIIGRARLFYLQNPLINHAVEVQTDYVFAQGMTWTARGKPNDVLQRFIDDPRNERSFTSHQARQGNERRFMEEGNIFFALFTNPTTGRVQVRHIPVEHILAGEIISNPEDNDEVWYYRRVWNERIRNLATGETDTKQKEEFYPDWSYRPRVRPLSIGGKKVNWDTPIYHAAVGGLEGWHWGIPEVYSALSWARAVTEDLTDYSTMRRAGTRYAHLLNVKGGAPAVASAKSRLQSTIPQNPEDRDRNPPPATASTWIQDPLLAQLLAAPKVNTPNPDEGRRLWLMAAAGVGLPETILSGDADVGNYATAHTLDRPTELKMTNRQELWAKIHRDIGRYLLMADARAPQGLLGASAVVEFDQELGTEVLVGRNDPTLPDPPKPKKPVVPQPVMPMPLAMSEAFPPTPPSGPPATPPAGTPPAAPGDVSAAPPSALGQPSTGVEAPAGPKKTDLTIIIDFPTVLERDPAAMVDAIIAAATMDGKALPTANALMPLKLLRRLLLQALKVDDIDNVLEELEKMDEAADAEAEAKAAANAASGLTPPTDPGNPADAPDSEPNNLPGPDVGSKLPPSSRFVAGLEAFRAELVKGDELREAIPRDDHGRFVPKADAAADGG